VSALLAFVPLIVFIRAKEQMSRIHASAIIAVVTYMQALGDAPMSKFVRYTMRVAHCISSEADSSVPVVIKRGLPFPAIVRVTLINLLPETFRQRAFGVGPMAFYVLWLIAVLVASRGGLVATASAKNGIIEGHQNLQFWRLIRERFQSLPGISIGVTGVIIAQLAQKQRKNRRT
jgi:hypothetical protein